MATLIERMKRIISLANIFKEGGKDEAVSLTPIFKAVEIYGSQSVTSLAE